MKLKREKNKINKNRIIKEAYQEHKVLFWIYIVVRLLVVAVAVVQFINGNYENVFTCILTLILFMLPTLVERRTSVVIPDTLEIVIVLFIFSAEILGEINSYYEKIPMWDTMLHAINGFISAAVGFSLVDLLNRNEKILMDMSPGFIVLVAVCFSMTIGVIWEFFEFFMDVVFHTDMQKDTVINTISSVTLNHEGINKVEMIDGIYETFVNGQRLPVDGYLDIGLFDTMKDLFVDFIGAAVFSFFGYFYIRSEGRGKFINRFILKRRIHKRK